MKILMFTNTYLPHVGGVARSVEAFRRAYLQRGHEVLIVAPQFKDQSDEEEGVIRVPAIQNFNGSDFSVRIPIPGYLTAALQEFHPDLVHAHHPFLLGDAALRAAAKFDVPLVFQHHTMYEQYTHYVPGDSSTLRQFVIDMTTEYANLCDQVFAPSESVAAILRERHIETPIKVVPTGVDTAHFARGDGPRLRRELNIPDDAFVVGYLGRLAPEKNLPFLAEAVARFLRRRPRASFLVVGDGPSREEVSRIFERSGMTDRLYMAGTRQGQDLVDAYHAMNVFAFASHSETQGMVLTEAMAAGCPVVGLDALGVREVVDDGVNGRLLFTRRPERFAAALAWTADRKESQYAVLCEAARATAERFSMDVCAEKGLKAYQSLIDSHAGGKLGESDWEAAWQPMLRRVETEWELLTTRAQAAGKAVFGYGRFRQGVTRLFRRFRGESGQADKQNAPSRAAAEPGLILIQIDGLSRHQFEQALARGRLPFLRRLLRKEHYKIHTLYSGLPSTTPAVQGELFYGVPAAVPAFCFRDRETGGTARMYTPADSARVQKRLALRGRGLMEGGSAYADIFSGGAAESHYCPATTGWEEAGRTFHPISLLMAMIRHLWSELRIVALLGIETVLALFDFARGMIAGQDLFKELKFIPTRLGICVLLRELAVGGAVGDAARGAPIVHLTFLGYDEQSHRRGPSSAFAHWSLKGIDDAIRRIWSAAHRSVRRDYQLWVYADHGQEEVVSYKDLTGRSIHEAVAEIFSPEGHDAAASPENGEKSSGIQYKRACWLGAPWWRGFFRYSWKPPEPDDPLIAAMGPLGHVYPLASLSEEACDEAARRLVEEARVPLVLAAGETGRVWAWTGRGKFLLPDEAADVLGPAHPLLDSVAKDLVRLCRHPHAGRLVLSGWRSQERPVSFARERGAHGGPGAEETRAFVVLPADVPFGPVEGEAARPADLRHAAMTLLGRGSRAVQSSRPVPRRASPAAPLRIVTYNVHSCVGTDGKLSPARIARVIAQCEPDVVALQELDVRRHRTGYADQPRTIARLLQMEHHFHPTFEVESEQYGNAVLSRFPLHLVRAAPLPAAPAARRQEPRSALWVSFETDSQTWQLLNVHLGLSRRERELQVEALLGAPWLGDARFREPHLLCGDLNAVPDSRAHRLLSTRLSDVQHRVFHAPSRRTFPSRFALLRLDHVFVGPRVEVVRAEVYSSHLARIASDHLPLLVELRLMEGR